MSDRLGVESLDREGAIVVLKFRQDAKIDPVLLLKLIKSRKDLTLLPPAVLRLDLDLESSPANRSSWWTARATSQVAPGFTRAEMTAEATPDPGVAGGLYERLGGLLEQLSQALITG